MFAKLFFVATLAIVSVAAKPGFVGAPVAYSAPLVAAPAAVAPALAYTAGYANVGDSAVVTSHNSQVINPAYAAYTAAAPLAYAAAAAPAFAPYAAAPYAAPYAAAPYAAQYAAQYAAPYAAPFAAPYAAPYAAAPLAYTAPLAAKYVL